MKMFRKPPETLVSKLEKISIDFANVNDDTNCFLTYAYKNLMVTLSVSKTKNRH